MGFSLADALPYLRCPQSGAELSLDGAALTTASGLRYPVVDGIADLTLEPQRHDRSRSDYDAVAGLRYNLFIFNPFTMAFTWGPGVLTTPLRMRPADELRAGLVLDVPCGTGIFTARAYRSRPEARILAVDYSMGMLAAAKRRAARLGVDNAVFVRADVARLPIADGCLDACLSMAGFHAFPDPHAAAAEIARALAPGGRLAATIACSGERRISDLMIDHVMKPLGYFRQALSVSQYRSALTHGGFTRIETTMAGAVAIVRATKG